MTPYERHLSAAAGYLELGMAAEAGTELDEIEQEQQGAWQVLALRAAVYQETGDWESLRLTSERLIRRQPEQSQWMISLAYATRRCRSLELAREILLHALDLHPGESTIPYNLACYAALSGDLPAARAYLKRAFDMNDAHRPMALSDPDLFALHEELRQGQL